ncbi:ABC transporter permease [Arthrobacter sp. NPDC057009]|uniref:ABC transporter permease n=1 Tax=Arthrobacter sp. NPDC057009 TaxID=3345996 RepID=UPI0036360056
MAEASTGLMERLRSKQELAVAVPTYVVVLALVLVPLGYLVYASLQSSSPGAPGSELTFDNIIQIFSANGYWQALGNSLWLGFLVSVLAVSLGVTFAWILGRTDVPFRRTLSVLVSLPIFVSPFALGIAWVLLGSEKSGLINGFLKKYLGESAAFMDIMSFAGLVFVMVLAFAPLAYLFTVGPMLNMDGSLEEASRVVGGSLFHTMRKVTLPVVMPGILSAALMIFVLAAEMFSVPGLIGTAAGYRTLPFFIYQSTTASPPQWGAAATAGVALLAIMMLGTILQARATKASSRFVTVTGKGARPVRIRLGRWRWPLFLIPAAYIFLGVVLPGCALFLTTFQQYYTPDLSPELFTLRWWERVAESEQFQTALRNTVIVGSATPTVAVTIAFAMAYVRNRTRAPFREAVETLGMLPVAVPGIVFGVGVLWAYVGSFLYGTVWLLLVAYCARFLPHALRVISSGMVQVDRSLEDAARVGGAGIPRTISTITVPLLKPAVLSGWLLLLIYCTRELNVAIMVYTSDSQVLPVLMWGAMEAGSYQTAAILAIIESTLILLVVALAALVLRVNLFPRAN